MAYSLAPRPTKPVPAGSMSGPRFDFLTLVSPGTQMFVAEPGSDRPSEFGRWRTVERLLPCTDPGWHGPLCVRFVFAGLTPTRHMDLNRCAWIRHPVTVGAA